MADADEEAIRGPSTEASQIETDLSDETQDFRLLNHLNLCVHGLETGETSSRIQVSGIHKLIVSPQSLRHIIR